MSMTTLPIFMILAATVAETAALSTLGQNQRHTRVNKQDKDRPLLRHFGKGINERVIESKEGFNRFGLEDHFTSAETIPCLDMRSSDSTDDTSRDDILHISSLRAIREAYTADTNVQEGITNAGIHGRSSGSGCCIIRLHGKDAISVRGLMDFADSFFEGVDDENRNSNIKDLGVFRIGKNIHAGFDHDVNEEGKMQVLYTKLIPGITKQDEPLLLPLEVGELVGKNSLSRAHKGMNTLFDIGSQITSAVLGMDSVTTSKLLDDCTRVTENRQQHKMVSRNADKIADDVSNSYQRIIRYLEPPSYEVEESDAAFWPHVDSTFLTLIPMPEIAGLEVWCPSLRNSESKNLSRRGEWVRPVKPSAQEATTRTDPSQVAVDCIHVVALAGEFLQLLSDGQVPTCIHRVIAPKPQPLGPFGLSPQKYKARVSAPLFLRPRRGEEAILDVKSDLRGWSNRGLYFEKGLLQECDFMPVWDYMHCISPDN
ncbi:hypothetical protein ACHAW6_001463 [Cyclotella cf. meneghiniana]